MIEGDRFPDDVMDSNFLQIRKYFRIGGDKKNAVRTEVLRKFPFPQFRGERHIRPSLIWKRISREYLFRYVNEVVQFKELQPGGLSDDRFSLRMNNPKGFRCYFREEVNIYGREDKFLDRLDSMVNYIRYSFHSKVGFNQQIKDINDQFLWLLALPAGFLKWISDKVNMVVHKKRT
jgi:hypothetical protein